MFHDLMLILNKTFMVRNKDFNGRKASLLAFCDSTGLTLYPDMFYAEKYCKYLSFFLAAWNYHKNGRIKIKFSFRFAFYNRDFQIDLLCPSSSFSHKKWKMVTDITMIFLMTLGLHLQVHIKVATDRTAGSHFMVWWQPRDLSDVQLDSFAGCQLNTNCP